MTVIFLDNYYIHFYHSLELYIPFAVMTILSYGEFNRSWNSNSTTRVFIAMHLTFMLMTFRRDRASSFPTPVSGGMSNVSLQRTSQKCNRRSPSWPLTLRFRSKYYMPFHLHHTSCIKCPSYHLDSVASKHVVQKLCQITNFSVSGGAKSFWRSL